MKETIPKKGALAYGLGPKGGLPRASASSSSDEEFGEEDAHGAAFDALAEAVGIPSEKRSAAQAALKTFVRGCLREYGSEE